MTSIEDKQALVDRSESFEEPRAPIKLSRDSKSLDLSEVKASPGTYRDIKNQHPPKIETSNGNDLSPWEGRINPFRNESLSEDNLTAGEVDLDLHESGVEGKDNYLHRLSHQDFGPKKHSDREAAADTMNEGLSGLDSQPGSENARLEGVSTSDKFESAEDSTLKGIDNAPGVRNSDCDNDAVEKPTSSTCDFTKTAKRKLTKYESLDLDIDNSNPFFDEVFQEYDRRIKAKGVASSVSEGPTLAHIPEGDIPETSDVEEKQSPTQIDPQAVLVGPETEMESPAAKLSENVALTRSETKDPDNAPLIGQGEETDKENKKSDGGLKADLETIKMDAEKEVEKVEVKDEEKPKEATEEVANEVKAEEAVQVADAGNKEEEAKAEVSGQTVVPQTAPKTENSPLITEGEEGKESKLKDQQPGFLCCNIL